jgi:hypothetical protein
MKWIVMAVASFCRPKIREAVSFAGNFSGEEE